MSQVAILSEDISKNLKYKIIENNGEYLIGYSGHFQLSKILYLNVSIFSSTNRPSITFHVYQVQVWRGHPAFGLPGVQ